MRNERQHALDRAVASYLTDCGAYLCPDDTLRASVVASVRPPARAAEITDSVQYLQVERRIHRSNTETGVKWSLTEEGRAWFDRHKS